MAPDGQTLAPNVYDAEPIPEAARAEIDRLLMSGDLFRYTAPADGPLAVRIWERACETGAGTDCYQAALAHQGGELVPADPARSLALFELGGASHHDESILVHAGQLVIFLLTIGLFGWYLERVGPVVVKPDEAEEPEGPTL